MRDGRVYQATTNGTSGKGQHALVKSPLLGLIEAVKRSAGIGRAGCSTPTGTHQQVISYTHAYKGILMRASQPRLKCDQRRAAICTPPPGTRCPPRSASLPADTVSMPYSDTLMPLLPNSCKLGPTRASLGQPRIRADHSGRPRITEQAAEPRISSFTDI